MGVGGEEPIVTVDPAIAQTGWLEIPAALDGASNNYVGTLYDGSTRNYSFLYDYSTYASLWVAYPLSPSDLSGTEYSHSSWAKYSEIDADKQVNISSAYGVSYTPTSYVNGNSYARGHQVPDADRDHTTSTMLSQTYLSINSTPQIQNGFNGGIWQNLENAIRTEVKDYGDTVYITTGPVFQTVDGKESITKITNSGDSTEVPVPNYYYKVVLKVSGNYATAIGFWFEHKEYNKDVVGTEAADYATYAVSVDEIEALTGLDFFVNLSDDLEKSAEENGSWTTFCNF